MCLSLPCFDIRPAGWDNERKISILYENMTTLKPDEPFQDAICKHVMRKVSSLSVGLITWHFCIGHLCRFDPFVDCF